MSKSDDEPDIDDETGVPTKSESHPIWLNEDDIVIPKQPSLQILPICPPPPPENGNRAKRNSSQERGPPSKKKISDAVISTCIPAKAPRDVNEYRVIRLHNGLRAVLIKEDENQAALPVFHHTRRMPVHGLRQFQFRDPHPYFKSHEQHLDMSSLYSRQSFKPSQDKRSFQCRIKKSLNPQIACKYASVSLCVNVGYFHDPQDLQGLAHFVEHVVHYGSKKYPEEEAFGRITTDFGLYANAFTEENTTTYFYNIREKLLPTSLDMFANMLLEPAFNEDVIRRELESIDNEFILRSHDFCNHCLLHQSLAKEGHPFRNFGWGDKSTLNKSSSSIQAGMQKFHSKFYTPNAMTLSISTSTSSLDEIETLVRQCFGSYANSSEHSIRKTINPDPTLMEPFKGASNSMYWMQGCGNKAGLFLRWILPPAVWQDTTNKSLALILDFLGDETEGSLSQYLKNEGLILSLEVDSCPCDHHWSDYNTFVDLRMVLTKKGLSNSLSVLSACQAYSAMLGALPAEKLKMIFNTIKDRETRNFNFSGPGSSLALAFMASRNLQRHEADDVLIIDSWEKAEFSYDKISSALKMLDHKNLVAIQILASDQKLPASAPFQTERFSGVKYFKDPKSLPSFDSNTTQYFIHTNNVLSGGPINPLNVEDHGAINAEYVDLITYDCSATKVTGTHYGHSPDTVYKCEVHINLISSFYNITARAHTLTKLWIHTLVYNLQPLNTHAERLGFFISIAAGRDTMSVKILGYPDRIVEVVQAVLDKWLVHSPIPENCFNLAKLAEMQTTDVIECGIVDASRITGSIIDYIDDVDAEFCGDTSSILVNTTYYDLVEFIQECKNCAYASVEGIGNIPMSSLAAITQIVNKLDISPTIHNPLLDYPSSAHPRALPPGEKCIRVKAECTSSRCTMITNLYQFGSYEPLAHYMLTVIEAFMCSKSFHQLRLKEQLGYYVATSLSSPGFPISLGIRITASASKHTPCELDRKMDLFMRNFHKYFTEIPDSDYLEMRHQLGIPSALTKNMIKDNMLSKLRPKIDFRTGGMCPWKAKGISKMSVQVLGLNSKECGCPRCNKIDEWVLVRGNIKLAKVQNTPSNTANASGTYFVHDLHAFKNTT